jgi:hypothetical protein
MTSVDGSEVHISTNGKPLFDPEGRFLGYRGVASHITAAVRAALLEEALQEAKVVGDNIAHDLRTQALQQAPPVGPTAETPRTASSRHP